MKLVSDFVLPVVDILPKLYLSAVNWNESSSNIPPTYSHTGLQESEGLGEREEEPMLRRIEQDGSQ
jgi:hypothetical protein